MRLALVPRILAFSTSIALSACSDNSSGSTQANTEPRDHSSTEKLQEPPRQDIECTRPDEAACARNCCPDGKPLTDFDDETIGCKAWLGQAPAAKCQRGISDKKPDPVSPLE